MDSEKAKSHQHSAGRSSSAAAAWKSAPGHLRFRDPKLSSKARWVSGAAATKSGSWKSSSQDSSINVSPSRMTTRSKSVKVKAASCAKERFKPRSLNQSPACFGLSTNFGLQI